MTAMTMKLRKSERFWELDFLRGLCVILMIFDHFIFNIIYVAPYVNDVLGTHAFENAYAFAVTYDKSAFIESARFIVRCIFFVLCGISCTLSKNNFRRFLPLALVALFINGASAVLDELLGGGYSVIFGVFHMLASSVLIYALIDGAVSLAVRPLKGERKDTAETALRFLPGVAGIVFIAVYFSLWGKLTNTNGLQIVSLVKASGDSTKDFLTGIFVDMIRSPYRGTADYFPLLPWGGFVLAGGLIGRGIYHTFAKNALKPLDGPWNAGVCLIGRRAAVFYLGHLVAVPAVVVLTALVELIF